MEADAHVATIRALSGSGMLGSSLGMAPSRLRSPLRYILLVPSLRDRAIFSGLFVSSKTSSSGPSVIHESGYCGMPLQPVIVFIEGAEWTSATTKMTTDSQCGLVSYRLRFGPAHPYRMTTWSRVCLFPSTSCAMTLDLRAEHAVHPIS